MLTYPMYYHDKNQEVWLTLNPRCYGKYAKIHKIFHSRFSKWLRLCLATSNVNQSEITALILVAIKNKIFALQLAEKMTRGNNLAPSRHCFHSRNGTMTRFSAEYMQIGEFTSRRST